VVALLTEVLHLDEDLLELLVGEHGTLGLVEVLEVAEVVELVKGCRGNTISAASITSADKLRPRTEREVHTDLMPVEANCRDGLLNPVIEPELQRDMQLLGDERVESGLSDAVIETNLLTELLIRELGN
jgi:hypothetical protein